MSRRFFKATRCFFIASFVLLNGGASHRTYLACSLSTQSVRRAARLTSPLDMVIIPHLGKNVKSAKCTKFAPKNCELYLLTKNRPWRLSAAGQLYHTFLNLSIGKLHKKNAPPNYRGGRSGACPPQADTYSAIWK